MHKKENIRPLQNRFFSIFIFIFFMLFIQTPMVLALSIVGFSVENQENYVIFFSGLFFIIWTCLVVWITRKYYRHNTYVSSQSNIKARDLIFNILWFIVIFIGNGIFTFIMGKIYKTTESQNNALLLENIKKISDLNVQVVVATAIFFIAIVFVAPYLEELTFRGIFKETIFNKSSVISPLILSSAIFSIQHSSENIISFFMYMFMGGCLYMAYNRRNNIKDSILVHILNNFLSTSIIIINLIFS